MPVSASAKAQFGKILVDDDFFLFRPLKQYRTNANIIILRTEIPVILDTGTFNNPPMQRVLATLQKYAISPDSIRYLIITHGHQDHFQNLPQFQQEFSRAQTICHKDDVTSVQDPYHLPSGFNEYRGIHNRSLFFSGPFFKAYSFFFYRNWGRQFKVDCIITQDTCISLGQDSIHLIHTPNHSKGQIIVLDNRKNLFLSDMVPFTPYIEISDTAIDKIMKSTERILQFDEAHVKRAIRAHGDIRRPEWEIAPWGEEKARFRSFLETIHKTIDFIPDMLKNRQLTTEQLTQRIIPNYLRYSKWITLFFMPPAITWTISYVLKLQREGKIHAIYKAHQCYWTN